MNSPTALKIAHIDTGRGLRGGQRQLLVLVEGLRRRGHDQLIVCLEGSGLAEAARREQIHTLSLPSFDPWHAFGIMLFRQQLEAWRPQILHAHDGRGQSIAWLASIGLPAKRIASRRVMFLPADRWTYRLKYKLTCDAVVAVSGKIRELSIQAGVPQEHIHVIPDGINIPKDLPTAEDRSELRTSWGFNDDHLVIGLLGASTREKGHDVAIAAMALLRDRLPAVRLVLAASEHAPLEETLGRVAAVNPGSVLRLASLRSLDDFFPGLDVFIMPSRSEGLGSSALWSMAYGIPVVATRVGGLPEIVLENETGWLVPPNDPSSLADAIISAFRDRKALIEFSRAGRRLAEGFSADIMVAGTEALYYRLINEGQ
jgi:glycosyltransferase involved in cell wall biosynthesis